MARPKMQKPVNFTASIQTLYEIVASFSDDKSLGQFFRKAVSDLSNGCSTKDVDIRIKSIYDNASKKLATQQNKQKNYNDKRKISGSGTPQDSEATTLNPINKDLNSEPCLFPNISCKKSFGEYGLVKLTAAQEATRRAYYGDDFEKAVKFLENYIMSLPSKAAKEKKNGAKYWREEYSAKDHYKILDEGNWVDNKIKQTKLLDKRLENANRGHKSFAEIDREARVRMIRGQSVNHESKVNDNCLTIEQLKELYG